VYFFCQFVRHTYDKTKKINKREILCTSIKVHAFIYSDGPILNILKWPLPDSPSCTFGRTHYARRIWPFMCTHESRHPFDLWMLTTRANYNNNNNNNNNSRVRNEKNNLLCAWKDRYIYIYLYIFSARSYSFEDAITLIYIIIGLRRRRHRKIVKLNLTMLIVWRRFRATKQINMLSLIFNRPRRVRNANLVFSSSYV